MTSAFDAAIREVIESIPADRSATCGAVARALGDVRAARAVAQWLQDHPDAPGALRVVRADGRRVLKAPASNAHVPASPGQLVSALREQGLLTALRSQQERLAQDVRETDDAESFASLGGVDVSYAGDRAFAVAVRCGAEDLEPVEIAKAELRADFPYIPGYLAFREFPLVERVVGRLTRRPDVLLVDGHGRLHPALFGFACYTGLRLDLPAVGVAKHPLCGRLRPARRLADGSVPVEHEGATRGYAWRPREAARSVYVSVGHRISLPTALRVVKQSTKARYPEPLKVADRLSKEFRRTKIGEEGTRVSSMTRG